MEADRRLWANVCLLHLKLLNYSLINKFRLQLAQPCKMRLHPVSIQSISIRNDNATTDVIIPDKVYGEICQGSAGILAAKLLDSMQFLAVQSVSDTRKPLTIGYFV